MVRWFPTTNWRVRAAVDFSVARLGVDRVAFGVPDPMCDFRNLHRVVVDPFHDRQMFDRAWDQSNRHNRIVPSCVVEFPRTIQSGTSFRNFFAEIVRGIKRHASLFRFVF